ncbi:uncharacterized protein PHALS_15384 [Plasmopara halstedii]|uniref:Uncharacterized protein n=1 Tax=Plasmopara halstedii TaxID=4781 RepID=A0A0P1AFM7_PLAHL|nr:uncharacterized protein PHALS_15384 [Plasmopara halstedii]CEG39401.1 hypothetical protein PHALS_15384 [Plasmopara halstedii]|eukprot:XP_024575770.1 hypothetical protein PHALS_15384 [Plasmopara halstedii]
MVQCRFAYPRSRKNKVSSDFVEIAYPEGFELQMDSTPALSLVQCLTSKESGIYTTRVSEHIPLDLSNRLQQLLPQNSEANLTGILFRWPLTRSLCHLPRPTNA